jgi:Transcription factor WhiB
MTQRGHVTSAQFNVKAGRYKRVPYPKFTGDEPCTAIGVDAFYPPDDTPIEEVRETYKVLSRVCDTCPMKQECLTWALHREVHGYWGGTSPQMRKELRQQLGIGVCSVEHIDGYLEQQQIHDKEATKHVQTKQAI